MTLARSHVEYLSLEKDRRQRRLDEITVEVGAARHHLLKAAGKADNHATRGLWHLLMTCLSAVDDAKEAL